MDNELKKYLEGLTEKKLKTNDKKLLASYNASRANVRAMKEDPEGYSRKKSDEVKNAFKDPKIRENYDKGMARRAQNDEWHKNVAIARKTEASTVEARKKRSERMLAFSQSERGQAVIKAANEKPRAHARPVVTPYGAFRDMRSTVDYFLENKLTTRKNKMSIAHLIRGKIAADPSKFYYISLEEYIMLTGKE